MKTHFAIPPVWLCWFTCLGGLAGYYCAHGDRVTAAVVSLIAIMGLAGYWLGGAVILAFLAAMTASGLFATRVAEFFGPSVGDCFGTIGILNRILATCIGCILIGFVAMLVVEIVWNRILEKRGRLRKLNQAIGLSLGALQGAVLSVMILGGALVAEPYARFATRADIETVRDFVGKCTADSVVKIGHASRQTPLGPFLEQYNPFERVPQLRRVRESSGRRVASGRPSDGNARR